MKRIWPITPHPVAQNTSELALWRELANRKLNLSGVYCKITRRNKARSRLRSSMAGRNGNQGPSAIRCTNIGSPQNICSDCSGIISRIAGVNFAVYLCHVFCGRRGLFSCEKVW
jgi:hypothetical protein